MNQNEIQDFVDTSAALMLEKGLVTPEVTCSFRSNGQPYCYITWDDGGYKYKTILATTVQELLVQTTNWLNELKSAEERTADTFRAKVADALDYAHAHNIEADFVNPLEVLMKKLSSNIIEHKSQDTTNDQDSDEDIPF